MKSNKITSGLEDYIEVISNYLQKYNKVRAIDIAHELGVSRASVSEALKRLAELGLINYGRYGAISMTNAGKVAAESVIRRHSVLHKFLCDILGLDEEEAAENACKIEHVISENMIERLDKFVIFNEKAPDFSKDFLKSLDN